jgi:pantoate--beta-alanine ligase
VRVIADAPTLRRVIAEARRAAKVIGLVPTMGALHAGHVSLVEASRRDCGITVVSIFVNPTQFGPGEDFNRYPRTFQADLDLLGGRDDCLVFAPPSDTMYSGEHVTRVELDGLALPWEGQFRPGHFSGVATIVLKLFNLVAPDRAYFGQKDYQQALVVRRMTADLDLPVRIEVCPTVREPDGLALSSRNRYLSSEERERALSISRSLRLAATLVREGSRDATTIATQMTAMLSQAGLQIDYVALADRETLAPLAKIDRPAVALIAARVGSTRLIDNELLV